MAGSIPIELQSKRLGKQFCNITQNAIAMLVNQNSYPEFDRVKGFLENMLLQLLVGLYPRNLPDPIHLG